MAHAVQMSLPGSPILLYGDEVGMTDDLSREERMSVRTPMHWAAVEDQIYRDDSLLSKIGKMARSRTGAREIGAGNWEVLDVDAEAVLALRHELDGVPLFTLVNLAAEDVTVDVPGQDLAGWVDVVADCDYGEYGGHGRSGPGGGPALELRGYGYRWLRRRDHLLR